MKKVLIGALLLIAFPAHSNKILEESLRQANERCTLDARVINEIWQNSILDEENRSSLKEQLPNLEVLLHWQPVPQMPLPYRILMQLDENRVVRSVKCF